MAQTNWQDYLKLMAGLGRTLEQLTKVERDKTAAAVQGDLSAVEECMKREQVLSLTLRGHDQKRENMLRALGLKGVSLSQLEAHSPEEFRLETKAAVEELRRQYSLFQAASEVARDTLEVNLRAIERMQAARVGDAVQAEEQRKTARQTDFRA